MYGKNSHQIQEGHKKHSSHRHLDPSSCLNFCHNPLCLQWLGTEALCTQRGTLNICVRFGDFSLLPCTGLSLATELLLQDLPLVLPSLPPAALESAVLPAQTDKTLVNPCHFHSFSYSALWDVFQMREKGKGRFSREISSNFQPAAAAEVASPSPAQLQSCPKHHRSSFMGTLGLCPELKVLKPMKLGLLAESASFGAG